MGNLIHQGLPLVAGVFNLVKIRSAAVQRGLAFRGGFAVTRAISPDLKPSENPISIHSHSAPLFRYLSTSTLPKISRWSFSVFVFSFA